MSDDQLDLFGGDEPYPPSSGITPETKAASDEAAAAIEPDAPTLRAAVFRYIRSCGRLGATDDEIQAALNLDGNTERPRRWELFNADHIFPVGHRINAGGRRCTVWCAYPPPPPRLPFD